MHNRGNRFDDPAPPAERRKSAAQKVKTLYIERIDFDDTRELRTAMNISVNELKRKIENLYGLDYNSLDRIELRVQYGGMSAPKLITQDDEEKSLFENHIPSYAKIKFGLEENRGGQINKNKMHNILYSN